jgi:RNA-splicing ligase RtcB
MVGVDIGCGMEVVRLKERSVDFNRLDTLIRKEIPSGRDIRSDHHELNKEIDLDSLRCAKYMNIERARRSIGTLGGGNHFIEIDTDDEGNLYLIVHSGSRHIGNEAAKYYQEEGFNALCGRAKFQTDNMIERMKAEGNAKEIQKKLDELKKERADAASIPKDMAYVSGKLFDDYLHDMRILQRYAALNRQAMSEIILKGMGFSEEDRFTTIHNYIDTEEMILRKGAVSAKKGERLLIPINMRDGSLICVGKGNPEWNFSAPHGAGRLMSRREAFNKLSVEDYREQMSGIFTTCINNATLDEAPMAYKIIDEILSQISPTVDVVKRLKPIYNFKASE